MFYMYGFFLNYFRIFFFNKKFHLCVYYFICAWIRSMHTHCWIFRCSGLLWMLRNRYRPCRLGCNYSKYSLNQLETIKLRWSHKNHKQLSQPIKKAWFIINDKTKTVLFSQKCICASQANGLFDSVEPMNSI